MVRSTDIFCKSSEVFIEVFALLLILIQVVTLSLMDRNQLSLLLLRVAEHVRRTEYGNEILGHREPGGHHPHMPLDVAVGIAAEVAPGPYHNELQHILIETFVR